MNYDDFCKKVSDLVSQVKGVKVRFSTDENGRFLATCSDGTTIIGCPTILKVTIKWGSGHQAMATI